MDEISENRTIVADDLMRSAREIERRILRPTQIERMAALLTPAEIIALALHEERERCADIVETDGKIGGIDRDRIADTIRKGD